MYYHHFQPIFNIHESEVFGYEGLLRSKHVTNPKELFEMAIDLNKLLELDVSSCEKAIHSFTKQLEQINGEKHIFLNIYPSTLISSFFKKNLVKVLEQHSILPNQIVMEVSESEQITNYLQLKDVIKSLKDLGVRIALDDLDKGKSSLKNLLELEPDYVKFDRYFAKDLNKSTKKQDLLKSILDYCSINDIKVVLEGIETNKELNIAKSLGVHYGQGFLLGKPNDTIF